MTQVVASLADVTISNATLYTEALVANKASKIKSEFLANMSHEIRSHTHSCIHTRDGHTHKKHHMHTHTHAHA